MRSVLEGCALPKFSIKNDASANANAVVTIAADADQYWVIDQIVWSYSDVPTGGRLTVVIGSVTLLDIDITAAGPGQPLNMPIYISAATKGEAAVVTLYAGGGSVVGKLNVRYR